MHDLKGHFGLTDQPINLARARRSSDIHALIPYIGLISFIRQDNDRKCCLFDPCFIE